MRVHFLLARRSPPLPSEIVLAVTPLLEARGVEVTGGIVEESLSPADAPADPGTLYVLKSYSELALAYAGGLQARGARLLHPWAGCLSARNKIVCAQVLAGAGVPAPRTWVTGDLSRLAPLLARHPLVVKPYLGWRGQGVAMVRTEAELAALPPPEEPVVVQELVPGPGEDLRVYVAGSRIFATRKAFSRESYAVPGRPVPVEAGIAALARRVGAAFGLSLFGLDVIEGPDGPRVVDVNYFPGYKGCPGAAEAVADVIASAAREEAVVARAAAAFAAPERAP
jgi:ribosomal protein S6--L-glutamate ligase